MENRYYDLIVAGLSEFFEQNGFKSVEDRFENDTKSIKISYNEAKSVYELSAADIADGNTGEYAVISAYLFDDNATAKDAEAVAIDFVDTLRRNLGIKVARKVTGEAALPTADSSKVTVQTLTAKLLATYPELKEVYKSETAEKGKFLYLDFSAKYFIPAIRKTLDEKAKKNVKKLMDMLSEVFTSGDRASTNLVVMMLTAAIGTSAERFETAAARLEDCPHLVTAVNNEIAILVKDKKLKKALNFEQEN